ALQAEKGHADVYTRAKQAVDSGRDAAVTTIYVCEVCGHTAEALPEKCPVCGAKKESYRKF
ncbi:MAG: rubredoxin-like domain-containing protein, partial [Chloroflexota bacterium]